MSQQTPPPGWYERPDGTRGYWDGQRWTSETTPGGVPPAVRKGIPALGWILIVLGALVVLCGGGGLLVAGMGTQAAVDTGESAQASASAEATSGVEQGLGSQDASGDVSLGPPDTESVPGWVTVPVTATNSSEKRSNYAIDVSAESPDGATQLDTSFTFIENVEPGQSAASEVTFFTDLPEGTVFVVKTVERTSAVG